MLKIYFCFPYKGVGGVSLLFLRVAEFLTQREMAECHLVDYADGFMAKNYREPRVKLDVYEDSGQPVRIPADAVAVFQSMTPWSIFPGIYPDPATRVFYWNCYPFNLVPLFPGLRRWMQHSESFAQIFLATLLRGYREKMRRLVWLMLSKRSLVFMDVTNIETTERYLGLRISHPVYVPIPLHASLERDALEIERDFSNRTLRVVWVGRIVDFKFYTLHRSLIELDRLAPELDLNIQVTIVGSGEFKGRLTAEVKKLSNLHCEFIDSVSPHELDDFVIRNTDLLIAMGTSALQGASMGIPTLLLDVAYGPVGSDYVFTWLHERSGYTLGEVVGKTDFIKGNASLAEHIGQLINDFPTVSAQTREYFERNHEISGMVDKFMDAINQSHCTFSDFDSAGLLGRGKLYPIFTSIRKGIVHR